MLVLVYVEFVSSKLTYNGVYDLVTEISTNIVLIKGCLIQNT